MSVYVGIMTSACFYLSGRSSCCVLVNAGRNTGRKGRNGEEHKENGLRRGETLGERPNLEGTPAEETNRGETRGEMAKPGRNTGRNGRWGETGENRGRTRFGLGKSGRGRGQNEQTDVLPAFVPSIPVRCRLRLLDFKLLDLSFWI